MTNTSWKTTLVGYLAAIWVAIQPLISNGDFEISRDWKNLVGAALLAIFGHLAKDYNATGIPKIEADETTK